MRRTVGAAEARLGLAGRVELELRSVDDDVRACHLTELAHLDRCPRRLHRAAPAEHEDLANTCRVDGRDGRIGRVRRRQLLGRQREHSGDIEGDVAVADHHRALVREVELELLEIRVAVVPGDELGCRPRAGQVLAGNAEPPVGLGADRVDHGVVTSGELVVRHVAADLDVAEEAEPRARRCLLERARHRLDVRVVRRDSEPDEPHGVGSRSSRSTATVGSSLASSAAA